MKILARKRKDLPRPIEEPSNNMKSERTEETGASSFSSNDPSHLDASDSFTPYGSDHTSARLRLTSNVLVEMNHFQRSNKSNSARYKTSILSSDEFTLNKLNTGELGVYGREKEVQRIEAAFKSMVESNARKFALVTIKGYSGTGKSALVREISTTVQQGGGLMAVGKFELESRQEPYTAFRTAFNSYIEELLAITSEEELSRIKKDADAVLGQDWRVLSDIFPNLHLLLGKTPEDTDPERKGTVESLEGRQGEMRLRFFFQSLVRCLCSSTSPMVLVLDDVQWADLPSIKLIDAVLCDTATLPALLIATYRDNEVDSDHPFSKLMVQLESRQIPFDEIALVGLDGTATNRIVSTVLRMESSAETESLAEVVCSKTDGNPFFILQFLRSLIDEGKLTYNFGTLRWYWSLDEVQNAMVTDNVAGLLALRITRLGQDIKAVLQVASCFGHTFDRHNLVKTVRSVVGSGILALGENDAEQIENLIDNLVAAGLLEDESGTSLTFVHDQIQAAASASIPEEAKRTLSHHISKMFLSRVHGLLTEHELFLAAGLSREASDFVVDIAERLSFSHMNLRASAYAMRKSAFDAALSYAEMGMKFLGPDGWANHQDVAFQLAQVAVEAANCSGSFDRMEHYVQEILRHDSTLENRVSVYRTRLMSYGVQGRFKEGIADGLQVLRELGFKIPSRNPSLFTVMRELFRTKKLMRTHSLSSLLSLPRMDDKKRTLGMGIIDRMSTMTYFTNKNLMILLFLRSVVWSAKYGLNEYSPVAFAVWGSISHTVFGNVDEAVMYAEVALRLMEIVECKNLVTKVIYTVYGHLYHWKNDMRTSIQPTLYGYTKGMEVGNVELAMYNINQHDNVQYTTGSTSLDKLVVDYENHVEIMKEYNQDAIANYALPVLQCIYKFLGRDSEPWNLSGSVMVEEDLLAKADATGNEHLKIWVASHTMYLAYVFGCYKVAGINASISKQLGVKVDAGFYWVPRHCFIDAMTALALYREGFERRRNRRRALQIARRMKKWQSEGNVNVIHMTCLIDAELAAIKGDHNAAVAHYRDSIRISARSGCMNDVALAHERAAEYYLSRNYTFWASHHFDESLRCYQDWMAEGKVKQLREQYGRHLSSSASQLHRTSQ